MAQRQIGEQRNGQHGDHAAQGRERDRESHIATGQVGDQIRGCTAGTNRHHDQANREIGLQRQHEGQHGADQWQQQELTNAAHCHRLWIAQDALEVVRHQAQSHAEHDQPQRQGQEQDGEDTGLHSIRS